MLPGPPCESSTNACVFSAWSFAGAAAACAAICEQNGHASQLLSSCCSHWLQNFFAKIQNPCVRIGGFGLGPAGAPGAPGIPGGPCIPGCCPCMYAPCCG